MKRTRYRVVVVGAGPTGLAVASLAKSTARQAGVDLDVLVLEQRTTGEDQRRHGTSSAWGSRLNGLSFSKPGLDAAASIGLSLSDTDGVLEWDTNILHRVEGTLRFDVGPVRVNPNRVSLGAKHYLALPHVACMRINHIEEVALAHALRRGVEVSWGHRVVGFDDTAHGASVVAVGPRGEQVVHDAWLVVVADGGGRAHREAVYEAARTQRTVVPSRCGLHQHLGVDLIVDSPQIEHFMLGMARRPSDQRMMSVKTELWRGIESTRTQRFDVPADLSIVQAAVPGRGRFTRDEKLAWLGWAAHQHGLGEVEFESEVVEFTIAATRSRSIVVRNLYAQDRLAGAKFLVGGARAATTQLTGAGYQITGLSDALAFAVFLRSVLPGGERHAEPDRALRAFERGRQNTARVLASRHGESAPRSGVRELTPEEFEHLMGRAREAGFEGRVPRERAGKARGVG